MRLPESMTAIAPVGAVLEAVEAGEKALRDEAARYQLRWLLSTADAEGLSRWEKDFGLPDWTGVDPALRRERLRPYLLGCGTLTVQAVRELVRILSGCDSVEVTEDFPNYAVDVAPVGTVQAVRQQCHGVESALRRRKPSHLTVTVTPAVALQSQRCEALHGGLLREVWAEVPGLP